MREDQLLQLAISKARAGHELTARELFLEVVELNPSNEVAWMWLTGLLDDVDECIYACEMVLRINPGNENARAYLLRLQEQKRTQTDQKRLWAEEQLRLAQASQKSGDGGAALERIRNVTQTYGLDPNAWQLLAELSPDASEKITALEKVIELQPSNEKAQAELKRLRHFKEDLADLATVYEEQGNFEKALETYDRALLQVKDTRQWNDIHRRRTRLENLRQENIAHIFPTFSVARLAGGPSLLYLSLLLIHIGLNPFANPEPLLFIGLAWTMFGGVMIAFATVRSHHRLWTLVFKDVSSGGSPTARFALAATGWILVLLPHILLLKLSYDRFFVPVP